MLEARSSLCPYCGIGCRVRAKRVNGASIILGLPGEGPHNGAICGKARDLSFISSRDRLLRPLERRESGFRELSWRDAIKRVAEGLREIARTRGPESLGFIVGAKLFNEEIYAIQKLARLLGTNNVDNCARLCHAPTVLAMRATTGAGALTCSFEDLIESDLIVLWGTNPVETYPVLVSHYLAKARARGAKLMVVDPIKTSTANSADLFIQVRPGTDVVLVNSMISLILREGLYDGDFVESRVEGLEDLEPMVSKYTPEVASRICGVPPELIVEATHLLADAEKGSLLWSMGVTQHFNGFACAASLATLAALLGWYGKRGTCVGGLRGQSNVQGACDMGAMPEFLPGYASVEDERERVKFARAWGTDDLPSEVGLRMQCMIMEADRGSLVALLVAGSNPAVSLANSARVRRALEKLELLVVQDLFLTETAQLADIVLPAASPLEKEGSATSGERRIQWSFRSAEPPGEARPDLWITTSLAEQLGLGHRFPYSSPEDVLAEINALVPAYAGATPERLKNSPAGVHWPCPSPDHRGTERLHEERFMTPSGKFRALLFDYVTPPEVPDEEFPLLLTTYRLAAVYNTDTMTGRTGRSVQRPSIIEVLVNPATAQALGLKNGEPAILRTRRGKLEVSVRTCYCVAEGLVSIPWHWEANLLTLDALDPYSGAPALKSCACALEPLRR
ncbi:MAG: formate dehydrogenase subunit alpha [Fervidicoccaceae archaeon]